MTPEGKAPRCLGIIMDGNRRWAKAQARRGWEGHTAGYQKLKEVLTWVQDAGIFNLIVYAFSSENWKREEEEVSHLLELFRLLARELGENLNPKLSIRFAGDLSRFPSDLKEAMQHIEAATKEHGPHTLMVAVSYGGRQEILMATNRLMREGGEVTEERFNRALWTSGFPDPDVIIRTGGEERLSNFLPWQSTYSELFFLKSLWPDFSRDEFYSVLVDFQKRKRNFGS